MKERVLKMKKLKYYTPYLLKPEFYMNCYFADGPIQIRPVYLYIKKEKGVAVASFNEDQTKIVEYFSWVSPAMLEPYSVKRHKEIQTEIDEYYADNYADADGEPR